MKKVITCIFWIIIIYFVITFIVGIILGYSHPDISDEDFDKLADAFLNKYDYFMWLMALVLAVAGTLTGRLPFTRSKDAYMTDLEASLPVGEKLSPKEKVEHYSTNTGRQQDIKPVIMATGND